MSKHARRFVSLSLSQLTAVGAIVLAGFAAPLRGQVTLGEPWPKFGRDERNSFYSPHRGPHSTPQLSWWAPLGTPGCYHSCSAAIARVGSPGENYVILGTPPNPTGSACANPFPERHSVLIFKARAPAEYDPCAGPLEPYKVIELPIGEHVSSAPLVLSNNYLVFQSSNALHCYDLSDLPAGGEPVFKWSSEPLISYKSSPTFGEAKPGGPKFVFALGVRPAGDPTKVCLVAITPFDAGSARPFDWDYALRAESSPANTWTCPAIGSLAPNDPLNSDVNLLYVMTWHGDTNLPHLFALFGDGVARGTPPSQVAWSTRLDEFMALFSKGSFGSPVLHSNGQLVAPSDEGGYYGFKNVSTGADRRWAPVSSYHISATPAVIPGDPRLVICFSEAGQVEQLKDLGDSATRVGPPLPLEIGGLPSWVWGGGIGDSARRYYVATGFGLQPPNSDGQKILAVKFDASAGLSRDALHWAPFDPSCAGIDDLRRRFEAPLAMDDRGLVVAVNDGYAVAVQPVAGDFNGDGCGNFFDIDAFVAAISSPAAWEAQYGLPIGINLLGVGDCNSDSAVNNFDLDCFVLTAMLGKCGGACDSCGPGGGGDGLNGPNGASRSDGADDAQAAYFWEVVAWLRDMYDMD